MQLEEILREKSLNNFEVFFFIAISKIKQTRKLIFNVKPPRRKRGVYGSNSQRRSQVNVSETQ